MSEVESDSNHSLRSDSSNNKIKIRHRFGMAPDHEVKIDPNLIETIKGMNRSDGLVLLSTILIPSIYGYRIQSKNSYIANQLIMNNIIHLFRIIF